MIDEPQKFIFLADLDSFFASVVLLDHPEYIGVPLIVGANPRHGKGRGVVSTCSYEARAFGIHSGMPISQAWERCPSGIYTRPVFGRIKEISNKVMAVFRKYNQIEQVSIDEAYLDMTDRCNSFQEAKQLAQEIKDKVQRETGVTCSIGVSFSKTLAKIGSDVNKPNGITVITPQNYKEILGPLKITRIPGIGKKSLTYYEKRGFTTIGDIHQTPIHKMIAIFGQRRGEWAWKAAHGKDGRKVHDEDHYSERKSISKERTFSSDVQNYDIIIEKISSLNHKLHDIIKEKEIYYRTISIKIRFQGFDTYTRAKSFQSYTRNETKAFQIIRELLEEFRTHPKNVRLIGLRFSNLKEKLDSNQTTLLSFLKKKEEN
ncbi:DNA polymerase IV [Candidatus Lokiarchaeum ossiferum]|uniref:DNA polymerase IV n=1 Tax=Candidatus Lokiarchaeum ossiferum TaxID=2951803 RepID=A0ABY6HXK3_9ARCH|nr:DNA polymerase IV [Candidatus Lokiarchaeum sp. B-35]